MRIAVLSDIHSNLEALDAVLARATELEATATWVLGDIVGYGADPGPVIDRVMSLPGVLVLAGNHDLAATDRFDTAWFNPVASEAIEWTKRVISGGQRRVLEDLEPSGSTDEGILVHGSIVDPAAEYVVDVEGALDSFHAATFHRCFFGHTHLPSMFTLDDAGAAAGSPLADGEVVRLAPEVRYMINPGSVGQPRDADPRASFMIFDVEQAAATVHRVAYDIQGAQGKIRSAGLPAMLADRLAVGR